MRRLKYYCVVLFQTVIPLVGLMLLVFAGAFVVSCNSVERHKVLTFFFEGVPPLGQDQLSDGPVDYDSRLPSQTRPKQIWFVHEPRKDCTLCHDKSKQRFFSSQTYLIKPVPELCYECHADYTTSASYVHGPVAVGQCLFCHHHHQSKIEHILKKPEPQLCYQCHNINLITAIPAHLTQQKFACTDCHDAHTSSIKYLLKDASLITDNGAEGVGSVSRTLQSQTSRGPEDKEGGLYDLNKMMTTTLTENNSMFQVFWTVGKLIEKGQIKEAQAYLKQLKQSNSFTDKQWTKVVQMLNLMDIVSGSTENADKSETPKAGSEIDPQSQNIREVAGLYYQSLAFYYSGRVEKAREGLLEVLKSELIPQAVAKSIKDDLAGIDSSLTVNDQKREIAELYYRSMAFYHAGQFEKAREGLVKVLNSNLAPAPMLLTIRDCLSNIDSALSPRTTPP